MREDNEKLRDMLEAIARINKYVGLGRAAFEESELIQTWYVRHLEIVGEAARSLSDDARKATSDVPWKEIIGMRNILAHNYFEIDLDIVWVVVSDKLPALETAIQSLLSKIDEI